MIALLIGKIKLDPVLLVRVDVLAEIEDEIRTSLCPDSKAVLSRQRLPSIVTATPDTPGTSQIVDTMAALVSASLVTLNSS